MADGATFLRHFAIAANQVAVAAWQVDALLVSQIVVKLDATPQVIFGFGDLVAASTRPQSLIEMPVLEMAQEAGGLGHRHVITLHDLAMTAGTT